MPHPEFDVYPYVGALPVRFGTARADVPALIGLPAKPGRKNEDWFDSIRVGYSETGGVADFGFGPRDGSLSFLGRLLWNADRIEDPMPLLLSHDSAPLEFYGYLIFEKIGVTCTGFHDDDHSQRAITVFRRGHWDHILPKAKRPDLSRYRPHKEAPNQTPEPTR
jgi:hypothetical protein